ncbi:hypothetical protein [Bathymodiolus platifrons methanotrophic gill symbiont]|uniref:hypothetical protein n=1 Tax=Bathymodiolus platifrons methanotrophic gill symbiont TaxID=113268 RepID=UPI0011250F50|nr:hypothetical protein [Bathymodiolus platifrons methanotrophic gill symbiont]
MLILWRTQGVWDDAGNSGRVNFFPLAWAGMPKTSFRKNSDSPMFGYILRPVTDAELIAS